MATAPFSAIVGQETMKLALILNAVNPAIGGVLLRGQRGTGKSTAARALAHLLPEIEVVERCSFNCDPHDPLHWCAGCRARAESGETLPSRMRPVRIIELPINASEDRVAGCIDVEAAVASGRRRFAPGLLADANRGIVYVDEVNLLDDHIVDLLLDAAASGFNVVEREGISTVHPSRFILIGTMNPEEGELRPQLLDRFGLCIDIAVLSNVAQRVAIMEGPGPGGSEDETLRRAIARAAELLNLIALPDADRRLIAQMCLEAGVMGHRADVVLARAAQTHCAWRIATSAAGSETTSVVMEVTEYDIKAVSEMVLRHRRRETESAVRQREDASAKPAQEARSKSAPAGAPVAAEPAAEAAAQTGDGQGETGEGASPAPASAPRLAPTQAERPVGPGEPFAIRGIRLPRDRKDRRGRGKRSAAVAQDRRGRYVRARQAAHVNDVALDATLRAAAAQHGGRDAGTVPGLAIRVNKEDLRQKVRHRKTGALIVFVVDASASMDAEQRMLASKGAVLSLLRDAYLRRDKVALVVFSGRTARVVLSPTGSIDLAEKRLQSLGVGGTTPLTHGLLAGLNVIRSEKLRDPTVRPLMVVISDGRGNISLFGQEPLLEAQEVAARIAADGIHTLVIDSARDHGAPASGAAAPRLPLFAEGYAANACLDLAQRAHGDYLGLYDLSQRAIVAGVQRTLHKR